MKNGRNSNLRFFFALRNKELHTQLLKKGSCFSYKKDIFGALIT